MRRCTSCSEINGAMLSLASCGRTMIWGLLAPTDRDLITFDGCSLGRSCCLSLKARTRVFGFGSVLLSEDVKGLESNVSLLLLVVLDGWSFSGVLPHLLGTAGYCCFMLLVAIDFSKLCNLATPSFAIHSLGAELWCRAVHNSQFGNHKILLQINSYTLCGTITALWCLATKVVHPVMKFVA